MLWLFVATTDNVSKSGSERCVLMPSVAAAASACQRGAHRRAGLVSSRATSRWTRAEGQLGAESSASDHIRVKALAQLARAKVTFSRQGPLRPPAPPPSAWLPPILAPSACAASSSLLIAHVETVPLVSNACQLLVLGDRPLSTAPNDWSAIVPRAPTAGLTAARLPSAFAALVVPHGPYPLSIHSPARRVETPLFES